MDEKSNGHYHPTLWTYMSLGNRDQSIPLPVECSFLIKSASLLQIRKQLFNVAGKFKTKQNISLKKYRVLQYCRDVQVGLTLYWLGKGYRFGFNRLNI
jgi:hypothetical protein